MYFITNVTALHIISSPLVVCALQIDKNVIVCMTDERLAKCEPGYANLLMITKFCKNRKRPYPSKKEDNEKIC